MWCTNLYPDLSRSDLVAELQPNPKIPHNRLACKVRAVTNRSSVDLYEGMSVTHRSSVDVWRNDSDKHIFHRFAWVIDSNKEIICRFVRRSVSDRQIICTFTWKSDSNKQIICGVIRSNDMPLVLSDSVNDTVAIFFLTAKFEKS